MTTTGFIAPQLATLVDDVPRGDDWVHEHKFDGYRIVAVRDGRGVHLYTRRGNDWTAAFPTVARALAGLGARTFVLDGEVAIAKPDGTTDFHALQGSIGHPRADLVYFLFDLLIDGQQDLRSLPLVERKARLDALLEGAPPILARSTHVVGRGDELFALACRRGLEGIVSKRATAPYASGRSAAWVKTKCRRRQELVVGGFTEPSGKRTGVGALLVGYFEGGVLRYAGKVGTGFDAQDLAELAARLAPLERAASAFVPVPPRASTGPRPHWVEPAFVVEVAFGEWTPEGRLRHPSFQGLRFDKPAAEVRRD